MRTSVVLALVLSSGCAPADPCEGPAPSIEACTLGVAFADCRGTGEPRFACRTIYECRWFAHGCVASEYTVEACPRLDAYGYAQAWGGDPWDANRETNVDVVIEPVSADARPSVTCIGPAFPYPCPTAANGGTTRRHADARTATFVTGYPRSIGGLELSVEIVEDDDGNPRARVCTVPYDDGPGVDMCGWGRGRGHCATTGRVTLGAIPTTQAAVDGMQIDVSATFQDGSTVELGSEVSSSAAPSRGRRAHRTRSRDGRSS